MAWRAPRYGILHAARDAGASAITPTNEDASFPKERLIDDRAGLVFKFNTSAAAHEIDVDRGAAGLEQVNRLYIPAGHNVTGAITVESDDNSGFSSPTSLYSGTPTTDANGAIDEDLTASTERYLRITFSATGQWEIPELIYTNTLTFSRGPEPEQAETPIDNVEHTELESLAVASIQLGAASKRYRYRYRFVNDSSDLTNLDLIAAHDRSRPVLLDPLYDTAAAEWSKMLSFSQENDHPNPASGDEARRWSVELRKHLL